MDSALVDILHRDWRTGGSGTDACTEEAWTLAVLDADTAADLAAVKADAEPPPPPTTKPRQRRRRFPLSSSTSQAPPLLPLVLASHPNPRVRERAAAALGERMAAVPDRAPSSLPPDAARDQGAESRKRKQKRNCGGSKEGFGACGARGAQGGDRGRRASPRRARRATRALPAGPADPGRLSDEEFQRGRFRFRAETGVHRRRQGAGPEGPRAGPDAPRGPLATPRRVIPEAPRRPGARGHLARSRRRHRRGGGDDAMRAIRPARRVRPRRPAAFVPGSESAARGARVGARVGASDVRRGRARFLRRVPRRRGSAGRRRPRGCNREDGVGSVAWRGVAGRGCPAGCRGGGRGRRVGVREGGFRIRV
jgi:hypothetical protein